MIPRLIVEADGGSRGNPGVAAGGAVVVDDATGHVIAQIGVFVGHATNNVAEYSGMLAGIKFAIGHSSEETVIVVRMDSKLVVEQMSGRWKIKHPDMATLAQEARSVIGGRLVHFEWVPRLDNARADSVANRAMDLKDSFELLG